MLDFIKDIGKALFHRQDDDSAKASKVQDHVATALGTTNIKVEHRDGQIVLSGQAASAEEKEKAMLLAGNIAGVSHVNAEALEAPAAVAETQYYEIRSGDTLSKIAQHFYHDANAYTRIYDANREVIQDPDLIYPGQKIRIPVDTATG